MSAHIRHRFECYRLRSDNHPVAEGLVGVNQGEDLTETPFHICPVCNHIELGAAPDVCPICGAKSSTFVRL